METFNRALEIVGGVVVAGGGLSLIVYQVFKALAVKWLDARFEERLQALKHEHGKEIEGLRFKIAALLDRTTKLHAREFEVLPEVWSKLNDAFWRASVFLSPFQTSPDIDRMPDPQQSEFIASSRLLESEKVQLRQAHDKTKEYQKLIFWHNLQEAEKKARDAYTYLMKNGIFISDDIRGQFGALHDLLWKALTERRVYEEIQGTKQQRVEIDKFRETGDASMKALERVIHERLWPGKDGSLTLESNPSSA
jgi:hypothetical protein